MSKHEILHANKAISPNTSRISEYKLPSILILAQTIHPKTQIASDSTTHTHTVKRFCFHLRAPAIFIRTARTPKNARCLLWLGLSRGAKIPKRTGIFARGYNTRAAEENSRARAAITPVIDVSRSSVIFLNARFICTLNRAAFRNSLKVRECTHIRCTRGCTLLIARE